MLKFHIFHLNLWATRIFPSSPENKIYHSHIPSYNFFSSLKFPHSNKWLHIILLQIFNFVVNETEYINLMESSRSAYIQVLGSLHQCFLSRTLFYRHRADSLCPTHEREMARRGRRFQLTLVYSETRKQTGGQRDH